MLVIYALLLFLKNGRTMFAFPALSAVLRAGETQLNSGKRVQSCVWSPCGKWKPVFLHSLIAAGARWCRVPATAFPRNHLSVVSTVVMVLFMCYSSFCRCHSTKSNFIHRPLLLITVVKLSGIKSVRSLLLLVSVYLTNAQVHYLL